MLMAEARAALRDRWRQAIGIFVLYILISIITGMVGSIGSLVQFLLDGPLFVGMAVVSLAIARGRETSVRELFSAFSDWLRTLTAYVIMVVFIILWALLLIVPGIIAAYSYSQTFFILAEDKTIGARDAIRKSKAMMDGHKKELFFLDLRFIGWFLLSILTLGAGFLWLLPYIQVTRAKFYDHISPKPTLEPTSSI